MPRIATLRSAAHRNEMQQAILRGGLLRWIGFGWMKDRRPICMPLHQLDRRRGDCLPSH